MNEVELTEIQILNHKLSKLSASLEASGLKSGTWKWADANLEGIEKILNEHGIRLRCSFRDDFHRFGLVIMFKNFLSYCIFRLRKYRKRIL